MFTTQPRPDDKWLQARLQIFESLSVASVSTQTNRNFKWLVFLDEDSPAWLRDQMAAINCGQMVPVYVQGSFTTLKVAAAVRARTSADWILTTRLDNDDALSPLYEQTALDLSRRQLDHVNDRLVINFLDGCQLADEQFFRLHQALNPFTSMIERNDDGARTVLCAPHHLMNGVCKVVNVRTNYPMWLQNIHGGNLANDVAGLRASSGYIEAAFPALSGTVVNQRKSVSRMPSTIAYARYIARNPRLSLMALRARFSRRTIRSLLAVRGRRGSPSVGGV